MSWVRSTHARSFLGTCTPTRSRSSTACTCRSSCRPGTSSSRSSGWRPFRTRSQKSSTLATRATGPRLRGISLIPSLTGAKALQLQWSRSTLCRLEMPTCSYSAYVLTEVHFNYVYIIKDEYQRIISQLFLRISHATLKGMTYSSLFPLPSCFPVSNAIHRLRTGGSTRS